MRVQHPTMLATGAMLLAAGSVLAEARVFMTGDHAQKAPSPKNSTIVLAPGETARIIVWLQDTTQEQPFQSYQLILPWFAEHRGASTGQVSYVERPNFVCSNWLYLQEPCNGQPDDCGGSPSNCVNAGGESVGIDLSRLDNVFFDLAAETACHETRPPHSGPGFGCFSALPSVDEVVEVDGVRYLMEFEIVASPDATGMHQLSFVPTGGRPAGGTVFYSDWPVGYEAEMQPLTIIVSRSKR